MGKETTARKAQEVREEIRQFAEQLRRKVYAQGHPDWGTLFSEIEELGGGRRISPNVAETSCRTDFQVRRARVQYQREALSVEFTVGEMYGCLQDQG